MSSQEQLDEISDATKRSYIVKATKSRKEHERKGLDHMDDADRARQVDDFSTAHHEKKAREAFKTMKKRGRGLIRAYNSLKEENEGGESYADALKSILNDKLNDYIQNHYLNKQASEE